MTHSTVSPESSISNQSNRRRQKADNRVHQPQYPASSVYSHATQSEYYRQSPADNQNIPPVPKLPVYSESIYSQTQGLGNENRNKTSRERDLAQNQILSPIQELPIYTQSQYSRTQGLGHETTNRNGNKTPSERSAEFRTGIEQLNAEYARSQASSMTLWPQPQYQAPASNFTAQQHQPQDLDNEDKSTLVEDLVVDEPRKSEKKKHHHKKKRHHKKRRHHKKKGSANAFMRYAAGVSYNERVQELRARKRDEGGACVIL